MEPENRLVARSLERLWEERLRALEAIEQDHERWRGQEPLVLSEADRAALQASGAMPAQLWRAPTTTAADRKRLLRFLVAEVALDQKRDHGRVWLKILWQTGAASEHRLQRRVHVYRDHADLDRLRRRVVELNAAGRMDREIAATLNEEGFVAASGCAFTGQNVWRLRRLWAIATATLNGVAPNPPRWPDGAHSVQGAATALGITPQSVFKWLKRGRIAGWQAAKGQPWKVLVSEDDIADLRGRVRRITQSRRRAS